MRMLLLLASIFGLLARGNAHGEYSSSTFSADHFRQKWSLQVSPLATARLEILASADSQQFVLPSPGAAESRSILYTLLPLPTLILSVPALIVGPATGFFYGGLKGRAWKGIGIRTLGLGGMFSAFGICGWDCGPGDSSYDIAWAVFIAGGGIVVVSAIYDMATVRAAVAKRNASLTAPKAEIVPVYLVHSHAAGAKLVLRF